MTRNGVARTAQHGHVVAVVVVVVVVAVVAVETTSPVVSPFFSLFASPRQ